MKDYKPNSNKFKEEHYKERVKNNKIVSRDVKLHKKSELRKIADSIIECKSEEVKDYIINEVAIPGIKNLIEDTITTAAGMLLKNDHIDRQSHRSSSPASNYVYTSYGKKYDRKSSYRNRSFREIFDYDDIWLESREEANDVLMRMDEVIDSYGYVSVADVYDFIGSTAPHTANKYGWTDIKNARIVRGRDSYWGLKLPKAYLLDLD